jgi:hypothetical protein
LVSNEVIEGGVNEKEHPGGMFFLKIFAGAD